MCVCLSLGLFGMHTYTHVHAQTHTHARAHTYTHAQALTSVLEACENHEVCELKPVGFHKFTPSSEETGNIVSAGGEAENELFLPRTFDLDNVAETVWGGHRGRASCLSSFISLILSPDTHDTSRMPHNGL